MMKNLPLTALFVGISLVSISFSSPRNILKPTADSTVISAVDAASMSNTMDKAAMLSNNLYTSLHLQETGLNKETLDYAIKGYQKLVNEGAVTNQKYLTIVDLSQSSRNRRFYLIDMENQELVKNTFVSHGRNSGIDQAVRFSNNPNSNESSLGFYVTMTTYVGKHGVSLKLSGLEKGFNDNAEARGIVVHGAPYVNEGRAQSDYMGRSQGCPALPENEYAEVISKIKDGSVLFIYNPDSNYLQNSNIING